MADAEIIAVGSEMLTSQRIDTNSLYITDQLNALGVEVRQLCQKLADRNLPNLWLPKERDFYAVTELPLLGSGKLDLKRVKEMALEKTAK